MENPGAKKCHGKQQNTVQKMLGKFQVQKNAMENPSANKKYSGKSRCKKNTMENPDANKKYDGKSRCKKMP